MNSIRSRLIAISVLVFGSSNVLLIFVAYSLLTSIQQEHFDNSLYNHGIDIASTIDVTNLGNTVTEVFSPTEPKKRRWFSVRRSYMQIRDSRGEIIARSPNLGAGDIPLPDEARAELEKQGLSFFTVHNEDARFAGRESTSDFRLLAYRIQRQGSEPMVLQIAAPLTLVESARWDFFFLLLVTAPVTLLIATATAIGLYRRAFQPVHDLIEKTARIQVTDLSERVQYAVGDAELVRLAATLNDLLEKVENSVHLQSRFIADASHQLKTPLAVLQIEVDTLSSNPGLSSDAKSYVASIRLELAQLIRLVDDLLLLAKMDAGAGRLETSSVRLDEVAMEAALRTRLPALKKGIEFKNHLVPSNSELGDEIDFEMLGDQDLLRSMLQTLFENAVKFSPPNSHVSWRLIDSDETIQFEIEDDGPGISPLDRETIFERFRQGTTQPHTPVREREGAGLGLSIAKRIAEAHHGRIWVEPGTTSGSRFIIEMRKN